MTYRAYVFDDGDREVLVTVWEGSNRVEVATRRDARHSWGPPLPLKGEPCTT